MYFGRVEANYRFDLVVPQRGRLVILRLADHERLSRALWNARGVEHIGDRIPISCYQTRSFRGHQFWLFLQPVIVSVCDQAPPGNLGGNHRSQMQHASLRAMLAHSSRGPDSCSSSVPARGSCPTLHLWHGQCKKRKKSTAKTLEKIMMSSLEVRKALM